MFQRSEVEFERELLETVVGFFAEKHVQHLPGVVRLREPSPLFRFVLRVRLVTVILCHHVANSVVIFDELFTQCNKPEFRDSLSRRQALFLLILDHVADV